MGFYKVAPYYYSPGFHEPNGNSELLVSAELLKALPSDLRAILEQAVASENAHALAESEWHNAGMLDALVAEHDVKLRRFPQDVIEKARNATAEVIADQAGKDEGFATVWASYSSALKRLRPWSKTGMQAFLDAREG